jgi:hypothetical protein
MKKTFLAVNSLAALGVFSMALTGCGSSNNGSNSNTPSPQPTQQAVTQEDPASLNGLSVSQLLQTKYDQVELDCNASLAVSKTTTTKQKNGGPITTTDGPSTGTGSASWDLLHDYSDTKELDFKIKTGGITYDVEISVDKVAIASNLGIGLGSNSYELLNTPVLTVWYSDHQESSAAANGNGGATLYENIPPAISNVNMGSSVSNGDSTLNIGFQGVNCLLNTKLKTAYQNEWQKLN